MVSIDGTTYHDETDAAMIILLERIRKEKTRCRFHWGDTKTGRDWGECYDVAGTIDRSTGSIKVPLLINNSRSYGGGAMLEHCIVKITHANKKNGGTIYQHPQYHTV